MPATLFDPLKAGPHHWKNRCVMAPMTRGRATGDGTPTDLMTEYYRQRSSAGLIVTEATSISPQGVGWVNAPGIYTDAHGAGWSKVTEAVHAAGGAIFLQLWHMGRASHPDFQQGELPVGPSAIAAVGESHTPSGKKPYVQPRALAKEELPNVMGDYVAAARRAIASGFDGVEIHGANGYLIDQFIRDGSNQRTDEYGGSMENRWRFPLEVAAAVADAIGADRTGIRLSPAGLYNGMSDSDPHTSYAYGAQKLDALGLVYLHVMEALPGHMFAGKVEIPVHPQIRRNYHGTMIINGGYDLASGNAALAEGLADAVAYGVPFLANPDLVTRLQQGEQLNQPDFGTFYTPGEKGYTDYPRLETTR